MLVDVVAQDFTFSKCQWGTRETVRRLLKVFLLRFTERVLDMISNGDDIKCDDRAYELGHREYHGHEYDEDYEECEVGNRYNKPVWG